MEQKRKLLLVYSTEELIKYKKKKKKQFLGLFPSAVLSYTIDSSHKIFKLKLLFLATLATFQYSVFTEYQVSVASAF